MNSKFRILIFFLTTIAGITLSSCNQKCKRKLRVTVCNGEGWSSSYGTIKCDSLNMTSTTTAEIFIDGTKMKIEGSGGITVSSNCY